MESEGIKMKILFVTTISTTANAFLVPHIRMLVEEGHQVDLAFNMAQEVDPELIALGCNINVIPFQRNPIAKENREAYRQIRELVREGGYGMVHTHTPIASFLTRMACRKERGVKKIYTAHGFHFHSGAPLKNWIVYYTAEWLASRYTDLIITINREDYERAKRRLKAKRVEYIPGIGLDIEKYRNGPVDTIEKRRDMGIDESSFVMLSVGELNFNKNHATVIRALSGIGDSSIEYIICGEGPLKEELMELVAELGLGGQVKFLGERSDLPEIYGASDIFVFPSRREGLGMAALEAMDEGLPIVTSNVHGIVDYSVDGVTGFLCDPTDVDAFADAIVKLRDDPKLRGEMGKYNREAVEQFSLENVQQQMKEIYGAVLGVKSDGD